jgi:hypothetical protein
MDSFPATSALSPKSGAVICHASKERFGVDLQTSDITPGMSMNTFEIYQSLRSFRSRKKVYLIWIQLKTFGALSKEIYPPSQHWWSGKQCATGLAAVSRYVRPLFKDTVVYETVLCSCYQSQRWSYAILVLFCDFSLEGYAQSMGVHWALLSNISMGCIAIINWNMYHILWIKSFELCLLVFLLFKK